jgi:hypothetical protein
MNTFYEHHKSSINFVYRCFDRILLNGLIQPFQQPERVIGFFNAYRNAERVTRNCLRDIAQQFQNWLKNRCEKWGVPVLDAETRCVFAPPALTTRRGAGDHLAPFRKYQIHEPANRITLAGGALRCDHKRDVERAYTIDPASMANRKRLISIPGRSSIQGRRSTSHPRHSPKLGERPQ